jgi:hypothetical protein
MPSEWENRGVGLLVRVTGRNREDELPVESEFSDLEELTRFLNRQGPYALAWIRLGSGEYVRYDHILSVRMAEQLPAAADRDDSLHS